jgi:hypothetical protein
MRIEAFTVDWRDGWLCVKYTSSQWLTPEVVTIWWPVRECSSREADELGILGVEALRQSPGNYVARSASYQWWYDLPLKDGGRTQPIHTEVVPYPCPKVRKGIEVEYRQGQWWKRLKSGWKVA